MPKNRKEDEPEALSANQESIDKGDKATPTKRATGLRKSESRRSSDHAEKSLLGRVFRKKRPDQNDAVTLEDRREVAVAPIIVAPPGAEDVLAHLSWRPRTTPPPPIEQGDRPAPRARRAPLKVVEPVVEPTKHETMSKRPTKRQVSKPTWETVPVPENAAQVILHEALPTIVHKKTIFPPFFLVVPLAHEGTDDTVLDEVRLASESGLHAVCLTTDLVVDLKKVDSTISSLARMASEIGRVNDKCRILLRANLVAPKDWQRTYKRAINATKGESEPSICDDEYWSAVDEVVKAFVDGVSKSKFGETVIGLHLDRAGWFYSNGSTYDASPSSKERFGQWLRQRYRDEKVALQAAWFDGKVDFESAAIPPPSNGTRGEEFVRIGRSGRRWVDYNLFLSDVTADRIAHLAQTVKKATGGKWLVGTNYGYTFEWSYPSSGHLSLGKLLRCPSIDYFSGPSSYKSRDPGGSASFPGPIDSFALNGKLFVSDDDFRTPISGGLRESSPDVPLMKTPQALESAHWRGAGAALAHGSGSAWIDKNGEGWLNSEGIWKRAEAVRSTYLSRYASPTQLSDVAVLIDERSLAYLVDTRAFEVLVQNVREAVLRSGLSANFYLLSDLAHRENFPDARLYLFLNAWDIRPEVRSAIKTRLQRDDKVLFWLYSAGLFEAGRDALERVREVTGIALKPQPFHSKPGTLLLNARHPICAALPSDRLAGGGQLEPSYFAIPEDGTTFGEYIQTGLASFVMREFKAENEGDGAWKSVFLGEPVVTPGLFRALGQMAGAHVWNFDDDVIHVKPPYLTVHCKGAGQRTITLPNNWCAYDVLNDEWSSVESNALKFNAIDGATYVFFVGVKSDIELRLKGFPDSALVLDKIDPRPDNTVHWDSIQFDVEIMKLDEWVEENWTEQHADDFLLKPSSIEIDPVDEEEEGDRPAHRGKSRGRGRRGRRPRGRGTEETSNARKERADIEFQDAGLGVMFRKKQ